MEKDHFLDRTPETTKLSAIKKGMYVFICEKKMQPYAQTLEDLTCVMVTDILTKHDHPRGIKVRGKIMRYCGGHYCMTEKKAVGRVVYIGKEDK